MPQRHSSNTPPTKHILFNKQNVGITRVAVYVWSTTFPTPNYPNLLQFITSIRLFNHFPPYFRSSTDHKKFQIPLFTKSWQFSKKVHEMFTKFSLFTKSKK